MHHLKYLRLINVIYGILLVLVGLGVAGMGVGLGLLAPEAQGGGTSRGCPCWPAPSSEPC